MMPLLMYDANDGLSDPTENVRFAGIPQTTMLVVHLGTGEAVGWPPKMLGTRYPLLVLGTSG